MAEVPSSESEGAEDLQRKLSPEEVSRRMNAVGGDYDKYFHEWLKTGEPFQGITEQSMRAYETGMRFGQSLRKSPSGVQYRTVRIPAEVDVDAGNAEFKALLEMERTKAEKGLQQ